MMSHHLIALADVMERKKKRELEELKGLPPRMVLLYQLRKGEKIKKQGILGIVRGTKVGEILKKLKDTKEISEEAWKRLEKAKNFGEMKRILLEENVKKILEGAFNELKKIVEKENYYSQYTGVYVGKKELEEIKKNYSKTVERALSLLGSIMQNMPGIVSLLLHRLKKDRELRVGFLLNLHFNVGTLISCLDPKKIEKEDKNALSTLGEILELKANSFKEMEENIIGVYSKFLESPPAKEAGEG